MDRLVKCVCLVVLLILAAYMAFMIVTVPPAHGHAPKPLSRAEPIVRMVLQEANNEPFKGQVAVAATVFDRVADGRWPDTEHGVVYQPYQYSGMALDLRRYTAIQIESARRAVHVARLGARPCGASVLWYHTLDVNPTWDAKMELACVIGNHIFFKEW